MLHPKVTRIGGTFGQTYAFSPVPGKKIASGVGKKRKSLLPSNSVPLKVTKVLPAAPKKGKKKTKTKTGL